MSKPNVIVVGAGGVGVISAMSLCHANKSEVSLVVRSDYDKVHSEGYEIRSCDYGHVKGWKPEHYYRDVQEAAESKRFFEYIVVTMKNIPDGPEGTSVSEVIRPLMESNKRNGGKQFAVVLAQNGIDLELELANKFSAGDYCNYHVLSGIQLIGSTKIGPALIDQVGTDKLNVGAFEVGNEEAEGWAHRFVDIYTSGRNTVKFDPQVRHSRWKKLLYNAAINTSTALVGLDVTRSIEFSPCNEYNTIKTIFEPAQREIMAIASKEGIYLGEEDMQVFNNLSKSILFKTSMCVDVEKGQLMELEVILGNPLRRAKEYNVETPTLRLMYSLLTLLQGKLKEKRGQYVFDEKQLKLVKGCQT